VVSSVLILSLVIQFLSVLECAAWRQRTVAKNVATRPIFDLAMEEERQQGTPASRRWWEQDVDFEAVLEEPQFREE
jgi:hypothetical protein